MAPVVFKNSGLELSKVARLASRKVTLGLSRHIRKFTTTLASEIAKNQFIPTTITMYEDGVSLHGVFAENTASLSQQIRKLDVYKFTLKGNHEESLSEGIELIFSAAIKKDKESLHKALDTIKCIRQPWTRLSEVNSLTNGESIIEPPILQTLDGGNIKLSYKKLKTDQPKVNRRISKYIDNPKTLVSKLIPLLKDENLDVQWATIDALGKIGDKAAVPHLVSLLKDGGCATKERIAEALGKIGDKAAVPHLILLSLKNIYRDVQKEVQRALSKIGDKAALPHLIPLLSLIPHLPESELEVVHELTAEEIEELVDNVHKRKISSSTEIIKILKDLIAKKKPVEILKEKVEEITEKMVSAYAYAERLGIEDLGIRVAPEEGIASVSIPSVSHQGMRLELRQELALTLEQVLRPLGTITIDNEVIRQNPQRLIKVLNSLVPHEVSHILAKKQKVKIGIEKFTKLNGKKIQSQAREVMVDGVGYELAVRYHLHEEIVQRGLNRDEVAVDARRNAWEIAYDKFNRGDCVIDQNSLILIARIIATLYQDTKNEYVGEPMRKQVLNLIRKFQRLVKDFLVEQGLKEEFKALVQTYAKVYKKARTEVANSIFSK